MQLRRDRSLASEPAAACPPGQHLDLPIAERNVLLLAGGFAPPYLEQAFDGEMMRPLRKSLSRLNQPASLLWDGVAPESLEPPINMLRVAVHLGGLPSISPMTAACNARVQAVAVAGRERHRAGSSGRVADEVKALEPG